MKLMSSPKRGSALGALLVAAASVVSAFVACGGSESSGSGTTDGGAANDGGGTGTGDTETTDAVASENVATHESPEDCVWSVSDATKITLSDASTKVSGDGAQVDGSTVTISAAGTYVLSGELSDGQVLVATEAAGMVRLVLSGATIKSSTGAPIVVQSAEEVAVIVEGENTVADSATYATLDEDGEPNAAVYSRSNLTVCGAGSLSVMGHYNDGIASKNGLIIRDVTLLVTATDDGIRGKDYLVVDSGNVTVDSVGDGLKADNDADATVGYIQISGGTLVLTAGGDAINATSDTLISDGTISIVSGGGSLATIGEDESAKGIKGLVNVVIDGGTIDVDSADDAIHSNGSVVVNGGKLTLSSADDGIHADTSLAILGGMIDVTQSYEGIESALITVNGGTTHLSSSDDGINVAGGSDGSAAMGPPGGAPDSFADTGDYSYVQNGGYIYLSADGDGLDSNGTCTVTGGTLLVNGPTATQNAATDCGALTLSGGTIVSVHTQQMADEIAGSYTQNLLQVGFTSVYEGGSLIHIETDAGENVLTYAPPKAYKALVFTSPALVNGSYKLYVGGSSTGTVTDGLYEGGAYVAGTLVEEFTVSGTMTQVGSTAGTGGPGGTPPGGTPPGG